jgi:methyl-accepting chemotaxis protein
MVNGEQWRIYTLREPPKVIQVAQRSSVRHELVQQAAVQTLWPILVLVPLVCAAVMLVVRFSFLQLNRLGSEVQSIDAGYLQAPPTRGVPIELRPFIDSINRMIERLARSIETSGSSFPMRHTSCARRLPHCNCRPTTYSAISWPAIRSVSRSCAAASHAAAA